MMSFFRKFAKSPVATGILFLLIFSFAVFQGHDIFSGRFSTDVITAGSRRISPADFKSQFDRYKAQVDQQAGQTVPLQELVDRGIVTRMLTEMSQQEGFFEWMWRTGVRPGKALVAAQVRQIPVFFDQVTGRFDADAYRQRLAQDNLTPERFEQSLRDEIAGNHFATALVAGARAPRIYGALQAGFALETRDARWFLVDGRLAGAPPAPTDAQLTAFLNENADRLRQPEMRLVSVALFTPATVSGVTVTEQQIQERFNFRKASLTAPEARTFVTLTAPNAETAARIAQAMKAGQDPAAVGRANGNIEPVRYEAKPQSAVADAAVGRQVFVMQPGQVSDPVRGSLGITVVKLLAVVPGHEATLAEHRAAIEQELRAEAGRQRVYDMVQAYENARNGGKSMLDAAQQVGARVVQVPPFTREGQMPDGQRLNVPPQVLQQAYALPKGGESDIIDAGQGQYFALRVNDVRAAQLPQLAQVHDQLAALWTRREQARRLQEKANELATRVRGGQSVEAVAQSVGATLVTRTAMNRRPQSQADQPLIQAVFGPGRGQTFVQAVDDGHFAVGRVDAIHAPTPVLAAAGVEQVSMQQSSGLFQELVEVSRSAGSATVKVRNSPERARTALGLPNEPEQPAAKR